jgi:hypothetical protein
VILLKGVGGFKLQSCFLLARAAACGLAVFVGCGPQVDPRIEQLRHQVLTTSLNAQPSTIAATLSALAPDSEVTVAGRIYGGDATAFDPAKASFSIIDLPEPGHRHDDPGDCPFCKHKLADAAMAIVQISGADGNPIDIAADKLLGLSKNEDVIVSGRASKVGDLLMIQAGSVQRLDKEAAEKLAAAFAAANAKPAE